MKIALLSAFVLFMPTAVSAVWVPTQPIVPDCSPDCGFADLVILGGNIISFLAWIAVPLSAIAFAWAGFLYMTAGGSQDRIKQAHGIFSKVAIGLILALGAYLIVNLVVLALTDRDVEDFLSVEYENGLEYTEFPEQRG